jgi:hypothetical protein
MSIKENDKFSYRPNHIDRWWWSGWALHVAPEGSPLGAGGPSFLLPHLNIIVLNKVRNISKGNINENLKRKSLDNLVSRFQQNLNTIIK